MNSALKTSLIFLFSIILLSNLTGCASRGDIKNPLNPVGVLSQTDKEMATVVFYRSNDHLGLLNTDVLIVSVDDISMSIASEDTDPNFYLEANRKEYMSNEYTAGVHTFSFGPVFPQTAELEAGKTYYLAVSFHLGGTKGLQFRTKENFLESTKNAKQIEYTGEKCNGWSGCPKQVVN
jgi:hypothetical protein